jgi:nucleoside-diphosphate-sugar epimerase
MEIRKVALFGATGVMGKCIARELLRRNIQARVVSRSQSNLQRTFMDMSVELMIGDLMDQETAKRAADSCEVIFHCVGVPVERFRDHIPISQNTIAAMRATGAKGLLLSSFWSYGPSRAAPVGEAQPRQPASEKERIRKEQEDLFQAATAAVTILPDFYGPEAEIGFVNTALRAIAAGKTANWIGALDRPRELIYVPDAAFPIVELAGFDTAYGQRWNVAGPGAITPRQLLQMAAGYCGTLLKVRAASKLILRILGLFNSQVRAMQELYPLYMNPPILDASKLRSLIGTYPVTSYEEGIRKTVDWIRSDPLTRS